MRKIKTHFHAPKRLKKTNREIESNAFSCKKNCLRRTYIERNLGGGKRLNSDLKIRRRKDKDHSLGHATKKKSTTGSKHALFLF